MQRLKAVSAVVAVVVVACDATGPTPTMADVAGEYVATRLVTVAGEVETDRLAGGAEVTLTLDADGTTSGRLFVPGGDEDGSDYDVPLTGTWALAQYTVTLEHPADTFLRDMSFIYADGRLEGSETFMDERVEITLTRQ